MFGLSQPSGNHLTVSKSGPAAHAAAVRVRLITRLAMQLRARRRVEITVFSFHSRTCGLRSYRRTAPAGRVTAPATADGACLFECEWRLPSWREPSPANRAALREFLRPDATRQQYLHGVPDATVAPESYTLDSALLAGPGIDEIPPDLRRDNPNTEVHSDTGHFAAETHAAEFAVAIRDVLDRAAA